VSENYTKMKDG